MVRRSPARPSQLSDCYSSVVLAGSFLCRVNPLHPKGLRGGVIGLPHNSWWPVSGQTPSCYVYSPEHQSSAGAAMWVVGEPPHSFFQCMECSKTPLNLESSHVEASAPRARLFRRVSSVLLSLQRVFRVRGNYTLKWKFHFMVPRSPARPSQLPDRYSSGVLAGLFLHRVNPLHPEGLRGGVIGLPRPSWWLVSGRTPPCYIFPAERQSSAGAALWVVGEPPHSMSSVWSVVSLLPGEGSNFAGLQAYMAPGTWLLSVWTSHGCYLVHLRARYGSALAWRVLYIVPNTS